jgi:hypothetical protein
VPIIAVKFGNNREILFRRDWIAKISHHLNLEFDDITLHRRPNFEEVGAFLRREGIEE